MPTQSMPAATDTKNTNPKDMIGSTKLPLGLAPDTIGCEVALAYLEGALKYGRYNWRIAGVRASIYHDALGRHFMKWWNGEDADENTRVKHLASIIACAGILLDAELCDKLEDDRPPYAPMAGLIKEAEETAQHLRELFKDHAPKHYTIADTAYEYQARDDVLPGRQQEVVQEDLRRLRGEDAQSVSGWNPRPLVLRNQAGSVDGVQVAPADPGQSTDP